MKFHRHSNIYVRLVHLAVSDLKRSIDFYTNHLGFSVLEEKDGLVSLTANGKNPLITLKEKKDAEPKQRRATGLYHFAILLPTREDLGASLKRLIDKRYPLQGGSDHLFSEALYLADPDGNGVEIYTDRPADQWTWNDGELPFVSDPLDMEDLLKTAYTKTRDGLPADTVIGHIHLHVNDLERAKQFYVDGLGFDITVPFRHQALFVASGGYHHHVGLNTWNGTGAPRPQENEVGMKWYTIVFPSERQLMDTAVRLHALGYKVDKDDQLVFTEDPSGNRIQLVVS
ncbi:VOC family protein [Alkalihalobacillus sp. TS-13]|uniref:VOC family protein n=1 Tax=Alkalihalobacillus sp. TS-13 TaxID=2842455 RepID=UPI001C87961C|nr:VOC family protein [Alkalihalobacillus sp. TS-13]